MQIPRKLFTTYKKDLTSSSHPKFSIQEESCAENLRGAVKLHSNFNFTFMDDSACKALIADVAGEKLAASFSQETNGWSKAEICKAAAIYSAGGFYMDPDLNFRLHLQEVVHHNTTFIASRSVGDKAQFFQGFVGASRRHPVLKRFLSLLGQYYDGLHKLECPGDNSCNLGPRLLYEAYEEWLSSGDGVNGSDTPASSAQLMVESWKQAVPKVDKLVQSQDGIGCCCDVVIYDPESFVVPFYSRFPGHTWFCVGSAFIADLPEREPALCKELVSKGIQVGGKAGYCDRHRYRH
jgi:hypothetical protein